MAKFTQMVTCLLKYTSLQGDECSDTEWNNSYFAACSRLPESKAQPKEDSDPAHRTMWVKSATGHPNHPQQKSRARTARGWQGRHGPEKSIRGKSEVGSRRYPKRGQPITTSGLACQGEPQAVSDIAAGLAELCPDGTLARTGGRFSYC